MFRQRFSCVIFKQLLEHRTDCTALQINVTRSFYRNHDAINHFIRYLRKRQVVVGTPSYDWMKRKGRAPKAMIFKYDARNLHDFFSLHLGEWLKRKKVEVQKLLEEHWYTKYVKLGPDLAAAKFVLQCGGKVKFKNDNEWLDKSKKDKVSKLPETYDADYILEALDLNGYPLQYEHLHFIFNLYYLKQLSFKGCKTMDDWALDKISIEYPMLEHLDISECENVTERGLECLYRMPSLQKLTVTNHYGTAAFDLTCFMLEDVNPYLTCEVQQLKLKRIPE